MFAREVITNPRDVGAVIPSSRSLAQRMAQWVDPEQPGPVIELGGGTGVITEALLQRGVHPQRLVTLERSEALADLLRSRFPDIHVICGDAADLRLLLPRSAAPTPAAPARIVSSLPLKSLPPDKVLAILRQIASVLRNGGDWIQYTYALRRGEVPTGFVRRETAFVWANVPPARIDVFTARPRS